MFNMAVHAEQLVFNKTLNTGNYTFSYQWHDHNKKLQDLSFILPQKLIFDRYRNFALYKKSNAQTSVNNLLQRHLRKHPISGVQLSFSQESGLNQVNIKSNDQQKINKAYQEIAKLEQEFTQQYLHNTYYHQFQTYNQIQGVKPDHGRIAFESSADFKVLKTIILEKASIKNIRKVSNYVLGFIQNIPYSTLESRITSSGAGFIPPLKLLWENQGDCDSKVTLTAALLRSLMPRINMALIFIDNHALIGIELDAEDDDFTVDLDGITYIVAEPTGPAVLALGKIAPNSEQAILAGHYTIEKFHTKLLTN